MNHDEDNHSSTLILDCCCGCCNCYNAPRQRDGRADHHLHAHPQIRLHVDHGTQMRHRHRALGIDHHTRIAAHDLPTSCDAKAAGEHNSENQT